MTLGLTEMIFIFLVALLVFGPRKLPELGRQLGRAMTEFRRASNEFKSQLEEEMRHLEAEEVAVKNAALDPPPGTVSSHGAVTAPAPDSDQSVPTIHPPQVSDQSRNA